MNKNNLIYKKKIRNFHLVLFFLSFNILIPILMYKGVYEEEDAIFLYIIGVVIIYVISLFIPIIYFYNTFLTIKYPTRIIRRSRTVFYKEISKIKVTKGFNSGGDIIVRYSKKRKVYKHYLLLSSTPTEILILETICNTINEKKILDNNTQTSMNGNKNIKKCKNQKNPD